VYILADLIVLRGEEAQVDILGMVGEDWRKPIFKGFADRSFLLGHQLSLQLHTQFGMQLQLIVQQHRLAAHAQIVIDEIACADKQREYYDQ
jgi:hypothetical protein